MHRPLLHLLRLSQSTYTQELISSLLSRAGSEYGHHTSSLQETLGCLPVPDATFLHPSYDNPPFSIFTDIPEFGNKRSHHSTVCRVLTEDVLATRHADFTTVFTDASVDCVHGTVAFAFLIPPVMYRWTARLTHESRALHFAKGPTLSTLTCPPQWFLATDSRWALLNLRSCTFRRPTRHRSTQHNASCPKALVLV